MDQETMVHLHNGILCNRKKEGAPTLGNSMDGTGKHYAKRNKSGGGEKRTPLHCWWECRLVQPLWKTVWNFPRKLKMELPFDLAILLLGLYP